MLNNAFLASAQQVQNSLKNPTDSRSRICIATNVSE